MMIAAAGDDPAGVLEAGERRGVVVDRREHGDVHAQARHRPDDAPHRRGAVRCLGIFERRLDLGEHDPRRGLLQRSRLAVVRTPAAR
jgi:hypothetical protein